MMTIRSQAIIKTENASKYLVQLSKHWKHKFEDLTYTETEAHIPFREGVDLKMFADQKELSVEIITPSEEDALKMQDVFNKHIVRFAFREELAIQWDINTLP